MKELPIIFSTPMVQAILDGRKTQTRRVVKLPPELQACDPEDEITSKDIEIEFITAQQFKEHNEDEPSGFYGWMSDYPEEGAIMIKPRYQPGDLLWVREAFLWVMLDHAHDLLVGSRDRNQYAYKASCHEDWIAYAKEKYGYKWKPSIHMSKDAARIWLKVVNVRVERLNDISENDVFCEGLRPIENYTRFLCGYFRGDPCRPILGGAVTAFKYLWKSIHGEGSWEENPWVWVIEFEVVSKTGRP